MESRDVAGGTYLAGAVREKGLMESGEDERTTGEEERGPHAARAYYFAGGSTRTHLFLLPVPLFSFLSFSRSHTTSPRGLAFLVSLVAVSLNVSSTFRRVHANRTLFRVTYNNYRSENFFIRQSQYSVCLFN